MIYLNTQCFALPRLNLNPSPTFIIAIDVDDLLGIMFYTDVGQRVIYKANIDGTGVSQFYDTGPGNKTMFKITH